MQCSGMSYNGGGAASFLLCLEAVETPDECVGLCPLVCACRRATGPLHLVHPGEQRDPQHIHQASLCYRVVKTMKKTMEPDKGFG